MRKKMSSAASFIRTLRSDRRGATALMVGVAIVVLVGLAGFAIDLGHAYAVQRSLQASTDAAALAGAQDLANAPGNATTTAKTYSGIVGSKNALSNQTVTMVSGYPMLKCFKSTGVSCDGTSTYNGIQVKQQATVPMWFAQVLGINSITVTATATAGESGGLAKPLDVMLVLDTTASMNNPDPHCPIAGASELTCALAGVQTILTTLSPSADYIGLMAFPGQQSAATFTCGSSPKTVAYNASPVYQIVPLSADYRTSNGATSLNSSSALAKASGGISGCGGLKAPGGFGTFYADAITAAQTALANSGHANTQKVIIMLSDGDAGASSSNMPTKEYNNQCHEAITAAKTAAAAGTWVYSIAYGSSTSPTPGSCKYDSPPISAWCTMAQIASDSSKFYSDTANTKTSGCSNAAQPVSNLISLFQSIAYSLVPPRLLSDNTT
ncbi:MAG: pilus assembly protein TadG-related protein [Rhodopila sp.]|nr:pilus assembly protein TadG-related protein [Rhodopila sp.]